MYLTVRIQMFGENDMKTTQLNYGATVNIEDLDTNVIYNRLQRLLKERKKMDEEIDILHKEMCRRDELV